MSRRLFLRLFSVITCFFVSVIPATALDQWVDISSAPAGTPPTVEVREVAGGFAVDVDLAGFFAEDRSLARGTFTVLEVPEFGRHGAVGEPSLPFRTVLIPIANGPTASLTALDSDSSVTMTGITVMPQQAPEPDCGSSTPEFVMDSKAYSADRWFPSETARISSEVVVRGQRFLIVEVSPLAFNPARGEVVVRPSLRLNIELQGGVDAAAEGLKVSRRSAHFPTVVELDAPAVPDTVPSGIEYLIIAYDPLITALEPLAAWKRVKGLTTEIVPISTIGSTYSDLKTYLQNRYDSDPDLTYVLLAGDYPMIPSEWLSGGYGSYPSDLRFSCLDGTDTLADIVLGRLAVQTLTDCENVVTKILDFERDIVPGAWHGDYLMAAYLQDSGCTAERFFFETGTHAMHFIRDEVGMGVHTSATTGNLSCDPYYWRADASYYNHRPSGYAGQPVPEADSDLLTGAAVATQDITDAINAGVSLVQHRDHGGETGWGDPPFYNANVNALTNGAMTPVVYSVNCLTGSFDISGDSFAEAFMKKYPGGAVGVIAATDVSYSGWNDLLVHGSYDCFWDDYDVADGGNVYPHSFRPAEAYLYGKYYMLNWQGDNDDTLYEFELFHWHGDPEMMVFTATPTVLAVTTEPALPVGSSTLTVTADADGALVAVTDNGLLIGRGFVSGGVAVVDLTPSPEEPTTLDVVVTGHNLVPWQGTVEVIVPEGPWMAHRSHIIDDSAGNGDAIANPGEAIILPVTVENIGADDGTSISGVLSSGSAHVTVTDAAAAFPDATVGVQVQSFDNHFSIAVDPAAPNGHTANLTLAWTAAGGYTGSTIFSVPVCEALVISNVSVDIVSNTFATVSWTTNLSASTQLTYGSQTPVTMVEKPGAATDHVVEIEGLEPCTQYVFEVSSTSPGCYTTSDDNGGAYHRFVTTSGTPVVTDSTDTPLTIPDDDPSGITSVVTATSPYGLVDVDVMINITHTYDGDLDISLVAPDGTSVELTSDNGGTGENFVDTVFDDDAETSITDGSAPFTGSFRPEQPLSVLLGQPVAGSWTLKVVDDAGIDTGSLDSWQLRLTVSEPCEDVFMDDFESGTAGAWSDVTP